MWPNLKAQENKGKCEPVLSNLIAVPESHTTQSSVHCSTHDLIVNDYCIRENRSETGFRKQLYAICYNSALNLCKS